MAFLPVSRADMTARGWDAADFVLVTGDAYVDHPSFAAAILSRWLEYHGFRVAILSQPDWKSADPFKEFGKPRLAFLVSPGNLDSMVNHYTAAKRPRSTDAYAPGGKMGLRPDRASIVYVNRCREAYRNTPVILGGVEASLRRFAHYDYWEDKVRRSILCDAGADILSFGMGERSLLEIAQLLNDGVPVNKIHGIRGTCTMMPDISGLQDAVTLPSFKEVASDRRAFAESHKIQADEQDPVRGKTLVQAHGDSYLVQHPPAMPLSREELDKVYGLSYMRTWHPMYDKAGGVPALEEVKFSILSARGCYGGCSFCSIGFHQGRIVQSRSEESILSEAALFVKDPAFKGYIHDVGGPTANFREPACAKQLKQGACADRQCLFPAPCPKLKVSHEGYLRILRKLRDMPGVKKVFIRSGIRFDYLMADKDGTFFRELVEHHVSGQLKVAPEHASRDVLNRMGKSNIEVFDKFARKYFHLCEQVGKEQYLVPYLISGHPGSTLEDAVVLAEFLHQTGLRPEQVQDFYPTPGTLSTCMYYTGLDPRDMSEVYVPRQFHEKALQRALLQYWLPKNRPLIREALNKAYRQDLIGTAPRCLVPPERTPWVDRPAARTSPGRGPERGKQQGPGGKRGKAGQRGRS